jgi:hypothetical protein
MAITDAKLDTIRKRLAKKDSRRDITVKSLTDWTDGKGLITYAASGSPVTRERTVEKHSRTEADLTPAPLFDAPDKYKQRRPCTCKHHAGNKWRPLTEFSERRAKNGKMYPLSWCNACRAQYAKDQYHGLNKRMP